MQSTRSKLIQLLAEYNGKYVSGQTLSDALNISRTAVWKHMRQLEKEGYKIEGKEKLGYKVIAYPNTLSEYTIKRHLNTRWLGQNIIHTGSCCPAWRICTPRSRSANGHCCE